MAKRNRRAKPKDTTIGIKKDGVQAEVSVTEDSRLKLQFGTTSIFFDFEQALSLHTGITDYLNIVIERRKNGNRKE
jgi:hypothetical protein